MDEDPPRDEAAVVVLGDIGRSPRMCNHAKMLADQGFAVKVFGFLDTVPHNAIANHDNITFVPIVPPPDSVDDLPPIIQLPVKLVWNFVFLLFAMIFKTSLSRLRIILMQNPPALPTMPVCYIVSRIKNAKLSIDWHNYMYSILMNKYGLSDDQVFGNSGNKGKAVRVVQTVSWLEGICGKLADYNLCVTKAMKEDLKQRWGINATTFYDRPPTWNFRHPSLEQIHNLYRELSVTEEGAVLAGVEEGTTAITRKDDNGKAVHRNDRPLVLLSSTSWTADEKFEILLDALVDYDNAKQKNDKLPRILMIITGKGPLKTMYLEEIQTKELQYVDVLTPWLEASDYPIMLASADIGISLHTSTSGLDLPMKVVDMFGARVPVLAKNFYCIKELVEENSNGFLFDNSTELASKIEQLSQGFPNESIELQRLQQNMKEKPFESWETMWNKSAKPGAMLQKSENNGSEELKARIIVSSILLISCLLVICITGKFTGYL